MKVSIRVFTKLALLFLLSVSYPGLSSAEERSGKTGDNAGSDEATLAIKKMASLTLMGDSAVLDGVRNDYIDIPFNRKVSYEVVKHISYVLREKGYSISSTLDSSVGAWLDNKNVLKLKAGETEQGIVLGEEEQFPPLFINFPFSRDSEKESILINFHRNLHKGNQNYFTEAGELGIQGDAVMVFHISGEVFSTDPKVGHGRSAMSAFLINLKTGERLWEKVVTANDLNPTIKNFLEVSDRIMADFPDHW